MKLPILLVSALALLVVSGCGKKEAAPASPAAAATVAPAGPRVIEITAGDTMKFNLTSIDAKPGEDLKIILTNVGTVPKEQMGHNWVLLKKSADPTTFATSAMVAKATDYIPPALKDQIIAHSELIGPKKSSEVLFKAPTEPGEYTFLCSFPPHFQVGMKGVLVVK